MSYMDDTCDPFGVPYNNNDDTSNGDVESKQYTWKELLELNEKERKIKQELGEIQHEKNIIIKQLTGALKECLPMGASVEFKRGFPEIHVRKFSLSMLEELKNVLDAGDVDVVLKGDKLEVTFKKK